MTITIRVYRSDRELVDTNKLPQVWNLQVTDDWLEIIYHSDAVLLTSRAFTNHFFYVVIAHLVSREPFVSLQPGPANS